MLDYLPGQGEGASMRWTGGPWTMIRANKLWLRNNTLGFTTQALQTAMNLVLIYHCFKITTDCSNLEKLVGEFHSTFQATETWWKYALKSSGKGLCLGRSTRHLMRYLPPDGTGSTTHCCITISIYSAGDRVRIRGMIDQTKLSDCGGLKIRLNVNGMLAHSQWGLISTDW